MKIIVNDANILIDLVDLKILPDFFRLEYDFHSTELIMDELFSFQRDEIIPFIETGQLIIDEFTESDLLSVLNIRLINPSLSIQDCSAFYLAQKGNGVLLTSDNSLRKFASSNNLEVHGHFWIFDNLVDSGFLSGRSAINKLKELCSEVNPKLGLPAAEFLKRIKQWGEI